MLKRHVSLNILESLEGETMSCILKSFHITDWCRANGCFPEQLCLLSIDRGACNGRQQRYAFNRQTVSSYLPFFASSFNRHLCQHFLSRVTEIVTKKWVTLLYHRTWENGLIMMSAGLQIMVLPLQNQCIAFEYTGCGGNLNNFASMADCAATCGNIGF